MLDTASTNLDCSAVDCSDDTTRILCRWRLVGMNSNVSSVLFVLFLIHGTKTQKILFYYNVESKNEDNKMAFLVLQNK